MIQMKSKTWLDIEGVKQATKEASVKSLEKAAALVERKAKQGMKTGGKLRRVKNSKRKRTRTDAYYHSGLDQWVVPSPVGKPPHAQSRNLVRSIKYAKDGMFSFVIGPTRQAHYGRYHEFGKRPFMRPALYAAISEMPGLFKGIGIGDTPTGRRMNGRRGGQ